MRKEQFNKIQMGVHELFTTKRFSQADAKSLIKEITGMIGVDGWKKEKKEDGLYLWKKITFPNSRNYFYFRILVSDVDIYFHSYYAWKNGFMGMTRSYDNGDVGVPWIGKEEEFEMKMYDDEMHYDQYVLPQAPKKNYKVKLISENTYSFFEIIKAESPQDALEGGLSYSGFSRESITGGYVMKEDASIGEFEIQLGE